MVTIREISSTLFKPYAFGYVFENEEGQLIDSNCIKLHSVYNLTGAITLAKKKWPDQEIFIPKGTAINNNGKETKEDMIK